MAKISDPRHHHFGGFYQLHPRRRGNGPAVAVIGNCQAESLRILLASSNKVDSFRIPPIHEWESSDLPFVEAALAKTDVLISQPVKADYRDLPVGTEQLRSLLPEGSLTLRYPVLRYDGLMPYQVIIRSPRDPSLNPPVVPYHDLRILAAADRGLHHLVEASPSAENLRTLAELSVAQLRSREERHGAVVMSDHLQTAPLWHTINHPDNTTLVVLARRVLQALAEAGMIDSDVDVTPPADREMLGGLQAPVDAQAAAALGVAAAAEGRENWQPGVDPAQLLSEQLSFYRAHPEVIAAGMQRHAQRLALLGLSSG
ncbi:hypothetical protein COCCU_05975 [Corynebacterium occultum]|uniref:Polysaccharide biosynthesis enzyme WcbI domain-containing protein n=1 Tax=Corynebacterium occultum TaxID=2675219 RepID=A0A6B8VVJ1_9CORY|nr:WcbI family polysaccharide biosynthesis putative acetyltransferase [Corynebacterium occultum]QGU07139.1 hypothetical protein COCCU_05975 [Corynebacterium occultum]